ncbi:hypothetical protein SALBM135S_06787 [Streptomyces alboniger]
MRGRVPRQPPPVPSPLPDRGADAGTASGTSGRWNSFTGSSSGWKPVAFDLSAYAGKKVEVSLSAITDPSSGGRGLFADNAELVVGGTATETEGFETSLGSWATSPALAGSPNITGDWARTGGAYRPHAAVTARDSVLLGFGFEHVPGKAERAGSYGRCPGTSAQLTLRNRDEGPVARIPYCGVTGLCVARSPSRCHLRGLGEVGSEAVGDIPYNSAGV